MFGILVICLLLIGYVCAGYPLIMALFARMVRARNLEGQPLNAQSATRDGLQPVSIVIAVYNDAVALREKLRGMLAGEGALIGEVLVGSDGSTDGVVEALALLGDERIRVVEFAERRGKAAVLNELVPQGRHEIVVMMDARQVVAAGAISALARRFDDERVGVVSGELVFGENEECRMKNEECEHPTLNTEHRTSNDEKENNREWTRMDTNADASAFPNSTLDVGRWMFDVRPPSSAAEGMGAYWRYEKWIRKNEARVASVPGATGACYAIRKKLFRPIPQETILDDVAVPMRAVLAGYRCVFEEKAVVFDRPSEHSRQERIRKRRTLAGNVQLIRLFPEFLLPWRNPIWFQFVSHKMLRLVVPFAAIISVFAAGWVLYVKSGGFALFSGVFLVFCVFFAVFCLFGAFFEKKGIKNRFFSLFWMFFVLNEVTLLGVLDGVRGRYRVVWDKAYGGERGEVLSQSARRSQREGCGEGYSRTDVKEVFTQSHKGTKGENG